MKKFKVSVNGQNYFIRIEAAFPVKHGYYTTVFVEALNAEHAESTAIDFLKNDPKLCPFIENDSSDPPFITIESVKEIESFVGYTLPRFGLGVVCRRDLNQNWAHAKNPEMKNPLRQQLLERVQKIAVPQRAQFSSQACELLRNQLTWQNAKSILFYAPLPKEVDIWPLVSEALAADKIVALPGFDAEENCYVAREIRELELDLDRGQFGIREPNKNCAVISLNHLDLVLVPGVGFDLMGRRLGRGKGFYDRLLVEIPGTKCGVGFDEQIVEAIPTEPHDVHLNYILTPTRWAIIPAGARF